MVAVISAKTPSESTSPVSAFRPDGRSIASVCASRASRSSLSSRQAETIGVAQPSLAPDPEQPVHQNQSPVPRHLGFRPTLDPPPFLEHQRPPLATREDFANNHPPARVEGVARDHESIAGVVPLPGENDHRLRAREKLTQHVKDAGARLLHERVLGPPAADRRSLQRPHLLARDSHGPNDGIEASRARCSAPWPHGTQDREAAAGLAGSRRIQSRPGSPVWSTSAAP